jgi:hypothetical protein
MEGNGSTAEALTFEQLVKLREQTDAIGGLLRNRLQGHLETLRPLLAPRRLLGKYADRKEDVSGSERAASQVHEKFKEACGAPFSLTPDVDDDVLSRIDNRPELYPWEYSYEAHGEGAPIHLTITSPVRWVLTYASVYTLSQLREAVAGRRERRTGEIRQFLVNAIAMNLLLARYPGISQLFSDLRFTLSVEKCPGLGALPLVTLSAGLPSFRPADSLILTATRFSGVSNFVELVDAKVMHALQDPLKARLEELLR